MPNYKVIIPGVEPFEVYAKRFEVASGVALFLDDRYEKSNDGHHYVSQSVQCVGLGPGVCVLTQPKDRDETVANLEHQVEVLQKRLGIMPKVTPILREG